MPAVITSQEGIGNNRVTGPPGCHGDKDATYNTGQFMDSLYQTPAKVPYQQKINEVSKARAFQGPCDAASHHVCTSSAIGPSEAPLQRSGHTAGTRTRQEAPSTMPLLSMAASCLNSSCGNDSAVPEVAPPGPPSPSFPLSASQP